MISNPFTLIPEQWPILAYLRAHLCALWLRSGALPRRPDALRPIFARIRHRLAILGCFLCGAGGETSITVPPRAASSAATIALPRKEVPFIEGGFSSGAQRSLGRSSFPDIPPCVAPRMGRRASAKGNTSEAFNGERYLDFRG
jgi:hypothetical protein